MEKFDYYKYSKKKPSLDDLRSLEIDPELQELEKETTIKIPLSLYEGLNKYDFTFIVSRIIIY